jgi:hypothetical protein
MAEKEWPLPMGRTRRPDAAAEVSTLATSSAARGRTTSVTARSLPAQLRHLVGVPGGAGASVTGLPPSVRGTLQGASAQVNGVLG